MRCRRRSRSLRKSTRPTCIKCTNRTLRTCLLTTLKVLNPPTPRIQNIGLSTTICSRTISRLLFSFPLFSPSRRFGETSKTRNNTRPQLFSFPAIHTLPPNLNTYHLHSSVSLLCVHPPTPIAQRASQSPIPHSLSRSRIPASCSQQ